MPAHAPYTAINSRGELQCSPLVRMHAATSRATSAVTVTRHLDTTSSGLLQITMPDLGIVEAHNLGHPSRHVKLPIPAVKRTVSKSLQSRSTAAAAALSNHPAFAFGCAVSNQDATRFSLPTQARGSQITSQSPALSSSTSQACRPRNRCERVICGLTRHHQDW